ncbi:hypothetical protein ACPYPG_30990 [Streptomyces sp. FR-108]|uniref:hypothetical protein n=1 Tax=Streptomyces sp. FR-108 TaxID=3416665 RepID=UPI003CF96F84
MILTDRGVQIDLRLRVPHEAPSAMSTSHAPTASAQLTSKQRLWSTSCGGLTDSDVRGVWWDDRALSAAWWEIVPMPVYPSLTRVLAEALVDVLWFVEGSEDEQMDPDDAVKVLEGAAHLVTQLSSDQRSEFIDLLGSMAAEEADPSRRAFLEGFPEGFGLVEVDS